LEHRLLPNAKQYLITRGTAQAPTLTLDPPWSTVFRGESVTLMCSTSHPPGRGFTWYHNDKSLRSTIKNSLRIEYTEMSDTGRYQCEAPGSGRSDPVLLTISNDWLILQAPYYAMFEGDPLRLRCYGWRGAKVSGISYYRDGANVEPSHVNSELFIKQAKTRDSGRYHCTGSMRTEVIVTKVSSPKVSISVQGEEFLAVASSFQVSFYLGQCFSDQVTWLFLTNQQFINSLRTTPVYY
uniref:Ig-like domain-containing protein n=1 Tax=Terrapene triunguis TaxID=2587831 RepID=A0A674IXS1_9SAUR